MLLAMGFSCFIVGSAPVLGAKILPMTRASRFSTITIDDQHQRGRPRRAMPGACHPGSAMPGWVYE